VQTQDDAASATGIDKAIGVSDHDGFVVQLLDPSLVLFHGHDGHDDHGKGHDHGHDDHGKGHHVH
jgi:hypothetical protein